MYKILEAKKIINDRFYLRIEERTGDYVEAITFSHIIKNKLSKEDKRQVKLLLANNLLEKY